MNLGSPIQIQAKAGDVVLCHYQLAHTIAPNVSPNIRYAIYFRLHSLNHPPQTYRPESITNIWLDYPAMSGIVSKFSSSSTQSPNPFAGDPQFVSAMGFFDRAVQEDKKMLFANALVCYEKGLAILITIAKTDKNPLKQQYAKTLAERYMKRAEQIKSLAQGALEL